jgi:hypothetical protein
VKRAAGSLPEGSARARPLRFTSPRFRIARGWARLPNRRPTDKKTRTPMALQTPQHSDRNLALELVRVTEAAAIAAAQWTGRGNKNAADGAAVEAMRHAFDSVSISGTVVIGEGEMDEAPMLYIGEKVGQGGPEMDIAVDPLEGTEIVAKGAANGMAVIATKAASSTPPTSTCRRSPSAPACRKASSISTPRPARTSATSPAPRKSMSRTSSSACWIASATKRSSPNAARRGRASC